VGGLSGVSCDYGRPPSQFLDQVNCLVVPGTGCFNGHWSENVSYGELAEFVHLVMQNSIPAAHDEITASRSLSAWSWALRVVIASTVSCKAWTLDRKFTFSFRNITFSFTASLVISPSATLCPCQTHANIYIYIYICMYVCIYIYAAQHTTVITGNSNGSAILHNITLNLTWKMP